jgi:hypothetical protein
MATRCVWNSQFVTLTMKGAKGESSDKVALDHFELAIKPIPEGKDMRCQTHWDWLIGRWNDMMGWKAAVYKGLDRSACMPQWTEIMKFVEEGHLGVQMVKYTDEGTDSTIAEATQLSEIEAIQRLEEYLASPVDAHHRQRCVQHLLRPPRLVLISCHRYLIRD